MSTQQNTHRDPVAVATLRPENGRAVLGEVYGVTPRAGGGVRIELECQGMQLLQFAVNIEPKTRLEQLSKNAAGLGVTAVEAAQSLGAALRRCQEQGRPLKALVGWTHEGGLVLRSGAAAELSQHERLLQQGKFDVLSLAALRESNNRQPQPGDEQALVVLVRGRDQGPGVAQVLGLPTCEESIGRGDRATVLRLPDLEPGQDPVAELRNRLRVELGGPVRRIREVPQAPQVQQELKAEPRHSGLGR